ncbi:MAG: glycosyltransferase, partial [Flavobacterium sp.]
MYAPIVLFVYKRLDTLKSCVHSLQRNTIAAESELFVFSDAPANEYDVEKVRTVRSFLETIQGFKKITIIKAESNKGLAASVISGVTEVIEKYEKVIVLEDDLLVATNFLQFMNKAVDFYASEEKVLSISGFTFPVKLPSNYPYDVYFTQRVFSWGWATWKNKWQDIDWNVNDYPKFCA